MTLLGLLVVVIIFCLLFWAIQQLTAVFNVPPQIRTVIVVLLVVIIVLWLVTGLTGHGPALRLY